MGSIFVPELKGSYGLSTAQTQIIFGTVIGIFPLTMIAAARLTKRFGTHRVAFASGLLFFMGYFVAYISKGNFLMLLFGVGVLAGMGTGMGYLTALSAPVKWYPKNKGLITGIAVAGFGAGAILLSFIADYLLKKNVDVLTIFLLTGIVYGSIIILFAQKMRVPKAIYSQQPEKLVSFYKSRIFLKLTIGIFSGTFTGLLIIGNLKPISLSLGINNTMIVTAISVFALANFSGRVSWGWLSDKFSNSLLIPGSLILQGITSMALLYMSLSNLMYILIISILGFSFGANFVLYAKETVKKFGIHHYERIYPYIFLGYGLAGIGGPFIGGKIFDETGSYQLALTLSFALSIITSAYYIMMDKMKST